jgi:8-oxo-dGTP pyrophosphatase MutT (NUDIX family)
MSFLDRIKACNSYSLSGFLPFVADQKIVGWVRESFAQCLAKKPSVFAVEEDGVSFTSDYTTADSRTAVVAEMAPDWVTEGLVQKLRDEIYPVRQSWQSEDHFRLDRALVPLFGVRAYGVHLNGYVKRAGEFHLWVGKRSVDCAVEPGKLDNMVAGGQPAGISIMDNLVKECAEEAGTPADLALQAQPSGTLSYCFESPIGLKPDTLFCFDLEVPDTFSPRNQDGEIESFSLLPLREALSYIDAGESFKFNVSLVILDFAIRHGVFTPDNEPDYEAILAGLHAAPPARQPDAGYRFG